MTNLKGTIQIEILDGGRGYRVTNAGGAFHFLMGMLNKGWLDRFSEGGLYLCNKYQRGRRFAFAAYCEANGFKVVGA